MAGKTTFTMGKNRFFLPAAAFMALLLISGCSTKKQEQRRPVGSMQRPNILLIVVDTLRADHLGCYGEKRPTSPFMDQMARKGILFEQAVTVKPVTLPSFCSMLTSQIPRTHGVNYNGDVLGSEQVTLAEVLQTRGYHTAAFISAFVLDSQFGLNQGFEHYDQKLPDREDKQKNLSRSAEKTVAGVLAWADHYPDTAPYFAMVHFWDPHWPYMPPGGYLEKVDQSYAPAITGTLEDIEQVRKRLAQTGGVISPEARQLAALYAGEIRYTDDCIKKLIEGMESRGFLEHTIIVLTADHGENMWEHAPDYFRHGGNIYHTSVHVPLIYYMPGADGGPRRIKSMVRSIDLAPTLLELAGLRPPHEFKGLSYAHVIRDKRQSGDEQQPLLCFIEAKGPATAQQPRGVFDGIMKLIQFPAENNRVELYDLSRDYGEQQDISGSQDNSIQDKINSLLQSLNAWNAATQALEQKPAASESLSDDTKSKLKALGYVQ